MKALSLLGATAIGLGIALLVVAPIAWLTSARFDMLLGVFLIVLWGLFGSLAYRRWFAHRFETVE